MSLTRSQWLAIAGGALLIASSFLRLVDSDRAVVSLLGPSRPASKSYEYRIELPALGVATILYGTAAVLLSVWFSTARQLFWPATVLLVVAVIFAGWLVGVHLTVGIGTVVFFAGNAAVLAAARIDRRQFIDFVRRGNSGDGSNG